MQEHRFQIGENVYFTSRPIGHMVANSIYQVVKLLPSDGSDYQYRIKNPNEAFERVADRRFHNGRPVLYLDSAGFAGMIDKGNLGHVCSCCRIRRSGLSYNGSIRSALVRAVLTSPSGCPARAARKLCYCGGVRSGLAQDRIDSRTHQGNGIAKFGERL